MVFANIEYLKFEELLHFSFASGYTIQYTV